MNNCVGVYLILSIGCISIAYCLYEPEENSEEYPEFTTKMKDLYVIHAVKYDVGILTETNDTDELNTEKNQNVQLTFYNANKNDSTIDLGSIPLPVQTNVSGQVITGIAPVNLGSVDLDSLTAPQTNKSGNENSTLDSSVGFLPHLQTIFSQASVMQPVKSTATPVGIPPLLSIGPNATLQQTPLPVLRYTNLNVSSTPLNHTEKHVPS